VRRQYLVCYDVREERRLRMTRKVMLGFDDPIQYSVFLCALSERERVKLRSAVIGVVDERHDSVLIIDLAGSVPALAERWERLGTAPMVSERTSVIT
jgi:CRISPR-associated protein Cas2